MLAGDEKVEKATAGKGSSMQQIFGALCLALCWVPRYRNARGSWRGTWSSGEGGGVHRLISKSLDNMVGYTFLPPWFRRATDIPCWKSIGFHDTFVKDTFVEFMMSAASPFPKAIDEWQ